MACVGGGSNAIGMFHPFIQDKVCVRVYMLCILFVYTCYAFCACMHAMYFVRVCMLCILCVYAYAFLRVAFRTFCACMHLMLFARFCIRCSAVWNFFCCDFAWSVSGNHFGYLFIPLLICILKSFIVFDSLIIVGENCWCGSRWRRPGLQRACMHFF